MGNITQLEHNRRLPDQQWIQSSETFGYDWLDRLISAQGEYSSSQYSYDASGNRVTVNDLQYTYNEMNELTSISDGTTFTYDEMGNTLSRTDGTDTWSYSYDSKNLMIQVEKNQQMIAQYSYDGDGRRIKKTEWLENLQEYQTTIYIYSGLNVIFEKNLDNNQEATCIFGPGGRIARKVGELIDYYHADHLGSTRLITDETGNAVTTAYYTPFGECTLNGEEDPYLFNGREKDSSRLLYYGARYYDPETGRFLTRDTVRGIIETPQTLNKYIYCLNNPLKYIDPTGNNPDDPQDTVEEVFKHLQNVDPNIYAKIQEKVESGEMAPLEALAEIIELLGYTIIWDQSTDTSLSVIINDELMITVEINNTLRDWGQYSGDTKTLSVNFQETSNIADTTLTFLHEVCHAVLTGSNLSDKEEHEIVYGVEFSYMIAFKTLGVEYSFKFSTHLYAQAYVRDPSGRFQVPIPEILERWMPRFRHVIS